MNQKMRNQKQKSKTLFNYSPWFSEAEAAAVQTEKERTGKWKNDFKEENRMNFELTHQRRVAWPLCSKQRKHEIDDERRNIEMKWNRKHEINFQKRLTVDFEQERKSWREKGIQSWFGNEICDKWDFENWKRILTWTGEKFVQFRKGILRCSHLTSNSNFFVLCCRQRKLPF